MGRIHHAFILTIDPLHIGSGGYRLSRVDLPIIREPATNLPKIPGTSLSGAARSNAALMLHGRKPVETDGDARPTLQCAGQRGHCGECAVCYTFGSMKKSPKANEGADKAKREDIAYSGMVNLFDARLTFFPVSSMLGPVWVTSVEALIEAGFTDIPTAPEGESALVTQEWPLGKLNLGWMLLATQQATAPKPSIQAGAAWQAIQDRIVIAPGWLFSQIVNMNLETRTSVSIDPHTGAAEDGALFTYEAIPRAAWLHLELGENEYRPLPKAGNREGWKKPLDVAWDGLAAAELTGIGGMGTRGFGRIKLLGQRPAGG